MKLDLRHKVLPSKADYLQAHAKAGVSAELAEQRYAEHLESELWSDNEHLVTVYRDYQGEMNPFGGPRTLLSIRRIDGERIARWDDIQAIKNQILGEEGELVMLLPAESRKMDMVNQYWFYDNNGKHFPFGAVR